jgi:hypothetical protein
MTDAETQESREQNTKNLNLNLSKPAQEILQETSEQIKRQHDEKFVPWQEIEEILTKNFPNQEIPPIFKQIGLSASTFYDGRRTNKVKLTTKYALLGLVAEQQTETTHKFSHQELAILFSGLLFYQTVIQYSPELLGQISRLQTIVAKLMTHQS